MVSLCHSETPVLFTVVSYVTVHDLLVCLFNPEISPCREGRTGTVIYAV